MKIPTEALAKKLHGGWKASWLGFTLLVFPSDKKSFEKEVEFFHQPPKPHPVPIAVSVTPIAFGKVKGFKKVMVINEIESKSVDYTLEVPGGYATAEILKRGIKWEESKLEQCFHTIHIIQGT